MDSLIESGNPVKSLELIRNHILALEKSENYSELSTYLEVLGRAHLAISDENQANKHVETQLKKWELQLQNPKDLKVLWLAAASWYEYIGQLEKAYQAEFKAVNFARKEVGISSKELGKLLVNLGAYSVNRMDLPSAKIHLKEAESLLAKDPDPESIYRINSFLGNMAYFASRMDSAEYYYKKCLLAIETMDPSPRNSHYRPALILNNLSGVQSAQGKTSEAIQSMNETIEHLRSFQSQEKDPSQRMKGKEFYFQAIDNLGGIYKGLGNFRKAQDLLEYAYERKRETFGSDSKEVWLSEILLGQLYFEQEESEKARKILNQGLNGLKQTAGTYVLYEADGWYALARIEDASANDALAFENYQKADSLFQQGLEGEFDVIYLGFLKNYSLFLAESGRENQAIAQAQLAYEYVRQNQGEQNLMAFQQQLSVGEVFFELRRYGDAQTWSEKALTTLTGQFLENRSLLDSLQLERNKPQALLLSTKASYELHEEKDPAFLKSLLVKLESGLEALDRRKIFLESEEDINLMILENQEYFNFLEQLYLELYQKTNEKEYLANLLTMHESALYQRIRARLEQVDQLRFSGIPKEFFNKETELKSNLIASIQDTESGVEEYLAASKVWEDFLSQTRKDYPEYFDFRYASIQRDFGFITDQLPEETAVIRYLFVKEDMYAVVLGKSEPKFFKLDYKTAEKILKTFQNDWADEKKTLANLHQLYLSLWAPLEGAINQQRVLVVPDGMLFNLNFEILTPQKLNSYSGLATGSLLSKHSFSYHYSTLLFSYQAHNQTYSSNFTAFAPGFFDEMKDGYLKSVRDSLQIDKSYLTLIPQPFTDRLVNSLKSLFGGEIFTKEASTLDQFNREAGQNRILHIGTHAESDNISPDFSRLIFAKANGHPEEENSLFARDIYQLDLGSELAVLMACETGKPTYSPGEGMISLAHAFNYAGSKSLLMGIWKIDEQTSAKIAESFYKHLSEGKTKDKALQLAKLEYLALAEGRSLSPEFWAGLILMGDASPVDFEPVIDLKFWLLIGLGLAILGVFAVWFFKSKKNKSNQVMTF
ncbi:CHAT domain-containing tetratricopeptide repeat protein [Algoriphagus sp. A40]|uniref:CHAT domain-containing protein n=1 Tax=Algoriphagus sp. A40 TaxID=1945863 RepID=UPI0009D228F9|nr:CHAT domain-containing tetratricopeptide repeat protein [Algoriphagus sp. A40]OOG70616.1 hypothetical protein B0E43_18690 [Algoriphagus sp. A40]